MGEQVKLWMDDMRDPPDQSWTWVKTVEEAIMFLERGDVVEASLDHDLGEDVPEGRLVVAWMAEHDEWPDRLSVHSANPVGVEYMTGTIERYSPLRRRLGTNTFVRP